MHNKTGKVFVYGTLKKGGHYAKYFDKYRVSNKKAIIKGTMLAISYFPGVVSVGNNTVVGEIHEYNNFDEVLNSLDMIEGCSGENSSIEDLYNRKIVTVSTNDGEEEAWIYIFNKNIEGYEVVESGEWPID